MDAQVLVYGATGLSGSLAVAALLEKGHHPLLGGRDRHRLGSLAERLRLEHRCFSLDRNDEVRRGIRGVEVVLNAAGPFLETAATLAGACVDGGAHYVDLCGEAVPIERLSSLSGRARLRGVMVMPGVGFDIVPSDCLIARLAHELPGATRVDLGVSLPTRVSPGSARSFLAYARGEIVVRRAGRLQAVRIGLLEREFDYGNGPRRSSAIGWGDTASAYYTTGIPNVTTYLETTAAMRAAFDNVTPFQVLNSSPLLKALWNAGAELVLSGPSAAERGSNRAAIVAELEDDAGNRVAARLRTGEPYGFTAASASAIIDRICGGDVECGFQTPARVYGSDFVFSFGGVVLDVL